MSQFKYVIPRHSSIARIERLEVVKESSKMATVIDRYGEPMTRRKGIYVFDTWAEAHAELTRRAEVQLNQARRILDRTQGFADNVREMKPPITPEDPK